MNEMNEMEEIRAIEMIFIDIFPEEIREDIDGIMMMNDFVMDTWNDMKTNNIPILIDDIIHLDNILSTIEDMGYTI